MEQQKTQRLLSRAVWDAFAAMGVVRWFAVSGLDEAAGKTGRRRGLAVGAIDETGQVKTGKLTTAGVKRQYLGCVAKVANGDQSGTTRESDLPATPRSPWSTSEWRLPC